MGLLGSVRKLFKNRANITSKGGKDGAVVSSRLMEDEQGILEVRVEEPLKLDGKLGIHKSSESFGAGDEPVAKVAIGSSQPNQPKKRAASKSIDVTANKQKKAKGGGSAKQQSQKKTSSKSMKVLKRAPDSYYSDVYTLKYVTMYTRDRSDVIGFEKMDPETVSVSKVGKVVRFRSGKYGIGRVNYSAHPEIFDLIEVGYLPCVKRIDIADSSEIADGGIDEDLGLVWDDWVITYAVSVTVELSKPRKLEGGAVSLRRAAVAKGNAIIWDQAHSFVNEKLQSQVLFPNEGVVAELTASGFTKPEIANVTGWSVDVVKERLNKAYEKLNVRTKADLVKLVKNLSGAGNQEEVFTFSIAGTWYHRKEALGLLKAKASDLRVVREPENSHDKNAVRIELRKGLVGYVPKSLSREVANLIDNGFEPRFTRLDASWHYDVEYYWDEWDVRQERETERKVPEAEVTLVCKNPYVKKPVKSPVSELDITDSERSIEKRLTKSDVSSAVASLVAKHSLIQNEAIVIEGIALGLSRPNIADKNGWSISKANENAKTAYRKLDIHSKGELRKLIEAEASLQTEDLDLGGQRLDQTDEAATGPQGEMTEISYIGIADFVVRTHGHSVSHKGHEMVPVEARVNILVAGKYLSEKEFRAFYCHECKKYFVTNTTYDQLCKYGTLCCRVVEFDDVVNPEQGKGFASNFASEPTIHQFSYNVNKDDDLSSSERQAILSFLIENEVMSAYEIASFIEGLISLRSGNPRMSDAISKWKADVSFLEHYYPPKQSLKVGTMYVRKKS